MASHRWDSCDARCACKQKVKMVPTTGSVLYKDADREARRTGAIVDHPKTKLNFNTPDKRDMRDPETIGREIISKGNGGNEIPRARP